MEPTSDAQTAPTGTPAPTYTPYTGELEPFWFELKIPDRRTGGVQTALVRGKRVFAFEFAGLDDLLVGELDAGSLTADGSGSDAVREAVVKAPHVVLELRVKDGRFTGRDEVARFIGQSGNRELALYLWEGWKRAATPDSFTFRLIEDPDAAPGPAERVAAGGGPAA